MSQHVAIPILYKKLLCLMAICFFLYSTTQNGMYGFKKAGSCFAATSFFFMARSH